MNFYELVTETLALCGMTDADATDRSEYSPLFKTAFNEAYRKIVREKLHLWTTEEVTLDALKCFTLSGLSETATKITKISTYRDYSTDGSGLNQYSLVFDKYDGAGTIVVPGAEASGTVFVEYEYMPDMLGATYNIKAANTVKVIPIDEALTSAQATALAGQTMFVIDVSTGLYTAFTIASAAAGAAGAATITTSETISTAVADGDQIFIGDNWTPVFDDDFHIVLTYWAAHKYYLSRGANYASQAQMYKQMYSDEAAYINDDIGQPVEIVNAYSPQI